MHIRPYQTSDLAVIADVTLAANVTDTLSQYFTRDSDRYPFTAWLNAMAYLRNLMLGKGCYPFVIETDPWDYPSSPDSPSSPAPTAIFTPEIVGWAAYTRMGTSPTAKRWQEANSSYADALNRLLMKCEKKYYMTFKTVHHTYDHAAFNKVFPILSEPWDPVLFVEAWELNGLFIRPEWQRRGLGRKLMQWGMDRATEERIPLLVAGSALGGLAYKKAGFKSIGISGFGDYFDELKFGGEPMQRWVWEPEGMDLIEEARKNEAELVRKRKDKKAK